MSGRSAILAPTAYERMSPRRWIIRLIGSCADGLAPESRISCTPCSSQRSITRLNAATTREMEVRGRIMSFPPPLNDRCVGFSASAGSSCSSTMGQASLPRMARFA